MINAGTTRPTESEYRILSTYSEILAYLLHATSHKSHRIVNMIIFKDLASFSRRTRTVRKSDYTPALALPKHMAGIFDKKCRQKEKYREERTNRRMSTFNLTLQLVFVSLYTKFEVSILNGCGDIFEKKSE